MAGLCVETDADMKVCVFERWFVVGAHMTVGVGWQSVARVCTTRQPKRAGMREGHPRRRAAAAYRRPLRPPRRRPARAERRARRPLRGRAAGRPAAPGRGRHGGGQARGRGGARPRRRGAAVGRRCGGGRLVRGAPQMVCGRCGRVDARRLQGRLRLCGRPARHGWAVLRAWRHGRPRPPTCHQRHVRLWQWVQKTR